MLIYYYNLNIVDIYRSKLDLFILTTLVYSAELLTDFSYANLTVSYALQMHWTDSVFA